MGRLVVTARQVILVRHGPTDQPGRCHGQRSDPGLSAAGQAAVATLAKRLPRFQTVISSPAARARQTADYMSTQRCTVDERWAERDFGQWEGREWAELWPTVAAEVTATTHGYLAFDPPEAESTPQVKDRIASAVADLEMSHLAVSDLSVSHPIGVITHAGPIQLALSVCLGLPLDAAFGIRPAKATSVWLRQIDRSWVLERLGW